MVSLYRNFDPVQDHYAYANELGRQELIRSEIENEMYNLKHDALDRISKVIHPTNEADFIKLLQYGVSEELEFAKRIAENLGLSQGHFLALDGDLSAMRQHMVKESMQDIPESAYDYEYDRYELYN